MGLISWTYVNNLVPLYRKIQRQLETLGKDPVRALEAVECKFADGVLFYSEDSSSQFYDLLRSAAFSSLSSMPLGSYLAP